MMASAASAQKLYPPCVSLPGSPPKPPSNPWHRSKKSSTPSSSSGVRMFSNAEIAITVYVARVSTSLQLQHQQTREQTNSQNHHCLPAPHPSKCIMKPPVGTFTDMKKLYIAARSITSYASGVPIVSSVSTAA